MGYFAEERKTKRIKLLSNPKYWIDVYTDSVWGDTKKFMNLRRDGSVELSTGVDTFLLSAIAAWNLDDSNGVVMPITQENLDRLNNDDALHLVNEAGAFIDGDDKSKKKLPSKLSDSSHRQIAPK